MDDLYPDPLLFRTYRAPSLLLARGLPVPRRVCPPLARLPTVTFVGSFLDQRRHRLVPPGTSALALLVVRGVGAASAVVATVVLAVLVF